MKAIYVRNVPPKVADRIELLARREGMSVSSFVVRELAEIARRADNPALLSALPHREVNPEEIVADLEESRRRR